MSALKMLLHTSQARWTMLDNIIVICDFCMHTVSLQMPCGNSISIYILMLELYIGRVDRHIITCEMYFFALCLRRREILLCMDTISILSVERCFHIDVMSFRCVVKDGH